MSRRLISVIGLHIIAVIFCGQVYAGQIDIIYTGSTHAMLYPCNCPLEADGGVARRATLIKQLRKKYPGAILLDSGSFFAGGLMDSYTLNTELDMQRSVINIRSMELMKYDAVCIGEDEFNFGSDFLETNIKKSNLEFLSCNIQSKFVAPYKIKKVSGRKIGIIGFTNPHAALKSGRLEFFKPDVALKKAVMDLNRESTDINILLSNAKESETLDLVNSVGGIDIVVVSQGASQHASFSRVGDILVLRPTWQARRINKVSFDLKDKAISNISVEEVRVSDQIADDKEILTVLPSCFSDNDCKKEGFIGLCQNAATLKSRCFFSEANKVNLSVITAKDCLTCDTEEAVKFLKKEFPGLNVSYLYYPSGKTKKIVRNLGVKALPVYLFGKEIEQESKFVVFKKNLEEKRDFYLVKPEYIGLSYFLDRKKVDGQMDLFISLYGNQSLKVLEVSQEYRPIIHFLALEKDDNFDAGRGRLEIEEYLRAVCVKKYYPESFFEFIRCRAANIDTSWWQDCALNLDTDKIASCARGNEGRQLLKENISLNKELMVMFGPTYLINNKEIFGSRGALSKKELNNLIKR